MNLKLILLLCVLVFGLSFRCVDAREFRIAWMAPKMQYHNFSAASNVGALKLALQKIQGAFLEGHTIKVKWYDTDCKSKSALSAAVDARQYFDPDLFLGPPCSAGMRGVASLASHWNLPVFGWVSTDIDLRNKSMYSTLVRFLGPLNGFATTMKYVTSMFKWKRFAMIQDVGNPYEAVAFAIKEASEKENYTITSSHVVSTKMSDEEVEIIFKQVKKYARIIIFTVPWHSLRKYMLVAHRLGMADGEYAFLCIHGDLYTGKTLDSEVLSDKGWRRNDTDDAAAREAFEYVIHIIMPVSYKDVFEDFRKLATRAGNMTDKNWDLPMGTEPDVYSAFLYDTTTTWGWLVNKTLTKKKNPRDGSIIFQEAQWIEGTGLTGMIVLDNLCDRLMNIWMVDMNEHGQFRPVAEIYQTASGGIVRSDYKEQNLVRWGNDRTGIDQAPKDIPVCGFEGEFCRIDEPIHKEDYTDTIVGAAAGSSVVLMIAIGLQFVLKRYRRQRSLQSMIWQVRMDEIDFMTAALAGSVRSSFRNLGRPRGSKKSSIKSPIGSLNYVDEEHSTHSKLEGGNTMFGSVAYCRGSLVSVKKMTKKNLNVTKEVVQEVNKLMELKNQNICAFVGACMEPGRIFLLWEYCPKGSLQDVIGNYNIKLDQMFKFAISQDIGKGLEYIHKSSVGYHGNLKSTNCVIDSRWTCKLTDFGLPRIRAMDKASIPHDIPASRQLWSAPELLRCSRSIDYQKADIYSFGVILKEIFTRSGPYTELVDTSSIEILERLREPYGGVLRPEIPREMKQNSELGTLIEECWNEDPSSRPTASRVTKMLSRINPCKHMTMIDNMIAMLEKYANHLEELVADRTSELDAEKKKTENLLYRMLPQSVAEDLKLGKTVKAEQFDEATIYFSDIVGFTTICAQSTPIQVVNLLNCLYTLFDDTITKYDVYKVETIGDAYMLASGIPRRNDHKHIRETADCAMDLLTSIATFNIPHIPEKRLRIRIGIHSGPVVAGVVGLTMPRYCLFGDTVNTASRMESTGLPLKIHLSNKAKKLLDAFEGYHLESRGPIEVKGKGLMETFFLVGKDGFTKQFPQNEDAHFIRSSTCSDLCPVLTTINSSDHPIVWETDSIRTPMEHAESIQELHNPIDFSATKTRTPSDRSNKSSSTTSRKTSGETNKSSLVDSGRESYSDSFKVHEEFNIELQAFEKMLNESLKQTTESGEQSSDRTRTDSIRRKTLGQLYSYTNKAFERDALDTEDMLNRKLSGPSSLNNVHNSDEQTSSKLQCRKLSNSLNGEVPLIKKVEECDKTVDNSASEAENTADVINDTKFCSKLMDGEPILPELNLVDDKCPKCSVSSCTDPQLKLLSLKTGQNDPELIKVSPDCKSILKKNGCSKDLINSSKLKHEQLDLDSKEINIKKELTKPSLWANLQITTL